MKIQSFAPVSSPSAKILILGSMPGIKSLEAGEYYAHPQNKFWPILFTIFNAPLSVGYEDKIALLLKNDIALWDVLQHCERPGSLDSSIRNEVPNDFSSFCAAHPRIAHIVFNGQKARRSFKKWVEPSLQKDRYILTTLPSTSPANASWDFARKLSAWRDALLSS